MLQYRLTDDQWRDVTAFIFSEYSSANAGTEPPPVPYQEARLVAAGRTVFERRGCASCHHLPSIKDSGRIGPGLAGIADRDPDELPYGSKRRPPHHGQLHKSDRRRKCVGRALAAVAAVGPESERAGNRLSGRVLSSPESAHEFVEPFLKVSHKTRFI
jgi:hypothetical protein